MKNSFVSFCDSDNVMCGGLLFLIGHIEQNKRNIRNAREKNNFTRMDGKTTSADRLFSDGCQFQ